MNYYLKKIYFSIMLSIVLVLTVVTTTFAWYATNQHTTIDTIDISVTGQGYSLATDKGIILSVDGINFKNNLDSLDLKKAILLKKGYSNAFYLSENEINQIYSNLLFENVSPYDYNNLNNGFYIVNNKQNVIDTNSYICFDMYVSFTNDKITNLDQTLDLYFASEEMASSSNVLYNMPYELKEHPTFGKLPQKLSVNAVNAARMGVVVYKPVTKGEPRESDVYSNKIYTFSKEEPELKNGVYNFGGINTEYNTMLEYYNELSDNKLEIPASLKERKDTYLYGENVFDSNLSCKLNNMVRLRIYLWMEGWDSDCFNSVINTTINFAIKFTSSEA